MWEQLWQLRTSMKRDIEKVLENWRTEAEHKPLILRGARQVGKTFSVRALGGISPILWR